MNVKRLNSFEHDLIVSVARLYCEIWKEPPWNEDFWKVEEVTETIRGYIENCQAIVLAGFISSDIVGFTWGEEVDKKKMREINGGNLMDFIFKENPVFYISELAVLKEKRNIGIGKVLTTRIIDEASRIKPYRFCLRTDVKADAARALYSSLGFRDLMVKDSVHTNRTYWIR